MKLEPNRIISERYKIIERIGVGGMANVYCANDIKLDRKVTFKVLKEEFIYEEFIEKFRKEAMAAAKLSHTNIANVYDVGNDGNIYYIVMEYVDGYTLKDIIKIKSPFSNQEVLGISIQIANALAVAHNAGIIHRDIKPENILVTKDGVAKVTDFGIARAMGSNTVTTDVMGSVHYFSPEQAKGAYTDSKTDIYSLGIVMYEMITGKLPFDGEGVVQLAMKHINEPLPNMKKINNNISESIEKIIIKATSKNIINRYKTAEDLIEDLKKALYDESGNFVKEEDFADSPTVVISQEQIDKINELSSRNINEQYYEDEEEYEDDEYYEEDEEYYEEEQNKKRGKPKMKNTSKKSINGSLQEQREKALDRKITIFAILTGLAIATIFTSFLIFWVISGKKVEVPNFEGKTYEDAVSIARDKEIYIRNTAEEYSDTIEEGSIVSQKVKAGDKVKKGDTIDIVLSLGTDKIELKDFVGMDIGQVYTTIEDEKLNLNLVEEYIADDKVSIGKVVKQSPEGGSSIRLEDKVTLYVSKGKEDSLVIVPRLKNLTEEEAKNTLKSIGLKLGDVRESESSSVEKGKVISQSVAQGKKAEEGDTIDIVISKGKPKETEETKKETSTKETEEITTEKNSQMTTSENSTETTTELKQEITTEKISQTTTSAPILKDSTISISPNLQEGSSNVEVKVIKKNSSGESEIYVHSHSPKDFPLKINVSGNEPTEFKVYIDGKLFSTENKFN